MGNNKGLAADLGGVVSQLFFIEFKVVSNNINNYIDNY